MSRRNAESVPSPDALQNMLEKALGDFNPDGLVYLDPGGSWRAGLRSTWQRASNELWYRLWQTRDPLVLKAQCVHLFSPFNCDSSSWALTMSAFSGMHGCEATGAGLLAVAAVLCSLVELKACEINASAYVADWDYRGKALRDRFRGRSETLSSDFRGRMGKGAGTYLAGVMTHLGSNDSGLFTLVSRIIAREEWLGDTLSALLRDMKEPERIAVASDLVREHINPAAAMRSGIPEAFIRPSIELISDPTVPVVSGVPYEAVSLLGKMRDRRATNALVGALNRTPLKYTLLRANIIFALGRLLCPAALAPVREVLSGPRAVRVGSSGVQTGFMQSLDVEKREAVWALGRPPGCSEELLTDLARVTQLRDKWILAYLAFAAGNVGRVQWEREGHVGPVVLRTLCGLLGSEHFEVFEEAAGALTEFGYRDALDMMYSRDFSTLPILALKPSSVGLYELSETLLHLISVKKPVVMAVTGDSGTGKTYFCETIAGGFSSIKPHEILYLMRDRRENKTFDRMLGLKWLRRHVDPEYYDGPEIADSEEDPEEFFNRFMTRHMGKKLIILDGWRDSAYFHQVIKTFYDNGCLDVIVRFRTSVSTRRSNLEEREGTLEGVESHLPLVEEPSIENTRFYREGTVLVYNLDNSMGSRLNRAETLEVFSKMKVPNWTDQVRLGRFSSAAAVLPVESGGLHSRRASLDFESAEYPILRREQVEVVEGSLSRELNADLERDPNLLEVVRSGDVDIAGIEFYTQGQVAFRGRGGEVGVMVGFDDRIYSAKVHDCEALGLAVVGGDLVSFDGEGVVAVTSLGESSVATFVAADSPVSAISPWGIGGFVTGHRDGTLRLWSPSSREVRVVQAHQGSISLLDRDRYGRVLSAGVDGSIRTVDFSQGTGVVLEGHETPVSGLASYPDGRVVTALNTSRLGGTDERPGIEVRLVDTGSGACEILHIPVDCAITSMCTYFDGRIILGLRSGDADVPGTLVVADPGVDSPQYWLLPGHRSETGSCVTMGPRIVASGLDGRRRSIRIYGTELYVRAEHGKLSLLEGARTKPPYYRSLF